MKLPHFSKQTTFIFEKWYSPSVKESLSNPVGRSLVQFSCSVVSDSLRLHSEAIVCARSRGVERIELQTNATRMASVEFARHIGRLGFDNLLVSLHSHDPGTSDAQTLRGIANLNERSVPVTLNFVINGLNYEQVPAFVDFFLSRSDVFRPSNTLSFSFIQPNGGAWDHRRTLVPRISDVVPFLVKALATCTAHGLAFAISESGIPVCFVRDYPARHQEVQKSREQILDSLIAVNVREKVKGPRCRGCAVDRHCLGVWSNYAALHGLAELSPIADGDSWQRRRD